MSLSTFRMNTCRSVDSKGAYGTSPGCTKDLACISKKPQGSADCALRYRSCLSKRKCGNLVAARRGFTWMCPEVIIAKFGLRSKENDIRRKITQRRRVR